jgi:nucleotide-binding universal stress UspA family protein
MPGLPLPFESTNMKSKRLLLPINLPNSSFDTLLFAKRMADELPGCLTLVHVVRLNIAFETRVYDEVSLECEEALRQIGNRFFGGARAVNVSVRVGKPYEQIVTEAESVRPELIVLSSPNPSPWKRLFSDGTVKGVVGMAPCPTLVLPRIWTAIPEDYRDGANRSTASTARWLTSAPA